MVAILNGVLGDMIMPTSLLTLGAIVTAEIDYRAYLRSVIRIFPTDPVWAVILVAIVAIVQIGPFQ